MYVKFENYLIKYIKRYPYNDASEYFLWLLTKKSLHDKRYKDALGYLEESLTIFSDGIYSARNRFWLYKLNSRFARAYEAKKNIEELIVLNPDSSYTWTIIDRYKNKSSVSKLQDAFNRAVEAKDAEKAHLYHTLLFVINKNMESRNERIERLEFSDRIKSYAKFEDSIEELEFNSGCKGILESIEKYFAIGYIEGINREILLIPNDEELQKEKYAALSHYGERYGSYYHALVATLKLMKYYKLKENIAILSNRTIGRLFPYAHKSQIVKSCNEANLEKEIVLSVIKAESSFNHRAISPAGAVGLMQIMPATGRGLAKELRLKRYDLQNPATSIKFGVRYLSWLKKLTNGDFETMVASYNAGANRVKRWKKEIESEDEDYYIEFIPYNETKNYVLRTRRFLIQYRLISAIK